VRNKRSFKLGIFAKGKVWPSVGRFQYPRGGPDHIDRELCNHTEIGPFPIFHPITSVLLHFEDYGNFSCGLCYFSYWIYFLMWIDTTGFSERVFGLFALFTFPELCQAEAAVNPNASQDLEKTSHRRTISIQNLWIIKNQETWSDLKLKSEEKLSFRLIKTPSGCDEKGLKRRGNTLNSWIGQIRMDCLPDLNSKRSLRTRRVRLPRHCGNLKRKIRALQEPQQLEAISIFAGRIACSPEPRSDLELPSKPNFCIKILVIWRKLNNPEPNNRVTGSYFTNSRFTLL